MNISTNTNTRITARTTPVGFRRRTMAGALLALSLAGTAVGLAATSHADADATANASCQTDPFGPFGQWRRTLCDGPIAADGSWSRERTIWIPAHYSTPICTSRSGRSFSDCTGGYFVNQRDLSNETYPVRPDTVLPDEPGHLG